MENEIMNNEVIETEENEVTDLTTELETTVAVTDETDNSGVGLAVVVGIGVLAAAGAVALGNLTYKRILKPIGGKIKTALSKGKSKNTDTDGAVDTEFTEVDDDDQSDEN